MANLTTQEKERLLKKFMELGKSPSQSILKDDIRAAFTAIDDFLETNASAINTAFPQPFRGQASVEQKAFIVGVVAMLRAGVFV